MAALALPLALPLPSLLSSSVTSNTVERFVGSCGKVDKGNDEHSDCTCS